MSLQKLKVLFVGALLSAILVPLSAQAQCETYESGCSRGPDTSVDSTSDSDSRSGSDSSWDTNTSSGTDTSPDSTSSGDSWD